MFKVYNNQLTNKPNVLHFQGETLLKMRQSFEYTYAFSELKNENLEELTIISCWTDDDKCRIKQQCEKYGIDIINAVPADYDRRQNWYMPNKISFIIQALKQVKTKYSLIVDGYDVLFANLSDIVEKFKQQKYHILFNATSNNYPETLIDVVHNRYKLGGYCYFNAGCCIGYTEDLLKFYNECKDILYRVENPYDSEQFIVRQAFAKYSEDDNQDFIFFDYESNIFQTMAKTDVDCYGTEDKKDVTLSINEYTNEDAIKILITGSNGFIGKYLCDYFYRNTNYNIIKVDRVNGIELENIIDMIKFQKIHYVIHLAAQTSVSNDNIEQIRKDNIDVFIKLALACNQSGTKLVYASSSTANDANITSMYGLSKKFNEDFAKIYCPTATGVRLHNVYAANPRKGTLLWHLLTEEFSLPLYNNGNNIRSFTYIDDVIEGLILAMDSNEKLVNCCSKNNICTVKEFAEKVKEYQDVITYETDIQKKYDNLEQVIDETIPNIKKDDWYISIDEGLRRIFENN